jgi:hypothetical protein
MLAKRAYDTYLRGCGIKRMGRDLRSSLNKALQLAARQGRVTLEDELGRHGLLFSVVRIKDSPPVRLRSGGQRSLEEIPPSELQAAARLLSLELGLRSGSDEHLRAVLHHFGLVRLTTQVGTTILGILDRRYQYVDDFLSTFGNHALRGPEEVGDLSEQVPTDIQPNLPAPARDQSERWPSFRGETVGDEPVGVCRHCGASVYPGTAGAPDECPTCISL